MGSCCSRPASLVDEYDTAGYHSHPYSHPKHHNNTSAAKKAAAEIRKLKKLGVIAPRRITSQNSSGSTESLTGIPAAIVNTRKNFDAEHGTHSSSENSTSQLQALPSGCHDAAQYHSFGHPPREGDERGNNPRPNARGSGFTMPVQAVPQSSSNSSDTGGNSGNNDNRRNASASSSVLCGGGVAAAAGALSPARRGPKQALLSYAEQYRTLQPFLSRRLRHRRWRLVFSSDVHSTHLVDRCQRAFREEEVQWHAVTAAAAAAAAVSVRAQCGGGAATTTSTGKTAPDGDDALMIDGSYVSTASFATYTLLPMLALMETTMVVPAPTHRTTSADTLNNVIGSPNGRELPPADHVQTQASTVVSSHVCIGLFLHRRPTPDAVSTYRRSEVFFFLFLSPIQPTLPPGGAEVRVAEEGEKGQQQQSSAEPAVSAPPPSATQVTRRRSYATGNTSAHESGEESRETRPSSPLNRSSGTLAPLFSKSEQAPPTQTHRLSNVVGRAGSPDVGDRAGGTERWEADGTSVFDSPPAPPPTSTTAIAREHHHDVNTEEDSLRAFDRHGAVVEERRTEKATEAHGPQRQLTAPPAPNGVLSLQWQQRVEAIAHAQALHDRHGSASAEGSGGTGTHPSRAASPLSACNGSNEAGQESDEDTFSSASAADRPRRSATRRPSPPGLFRDSASNTTTDDFRATARQCGPPRARVEASTAQSVTLPDWAADAVNVVRSPNSDTASTVTPLAIARAISDSPTMSNLRPPHVHEAGNSFTLEDDLVSATTTVVSVTSAPGRGITWREDEDLSSYWPETAHTSTYHKNMNGNGTTPYSQPHSAVNGVGRRGQEWYSPANDPQMPPLSRASSFDADDTAECLTPHVSRRSTTLFEVPVGHERGASELPGITTSGGANGTTGERASPALPNLAALTNTSDTSPGSATNRTSAVTMPSGDATMGHSDPAVFNVAATSFGATPPTVSDRESTLLLTHRAASSLRPVSTRVEVFTLSPPVESHADANRNTSSATVASSSGEGNSLPEALSRSTSQLMAKESSTVDVYCTSTGAIYIWDTHRDRASKAHAGVTEAAAAADAGEHEFVFQRDATGVRWNLSYFMKHGYADGQTCPSSPNSPVGQTEHGSLFAFVRAHARQSAAADADAAPISFGENSAEILTSPLVKIQLCVISSRSMPAAFQQAAASSAA